MRVFVILITEPKRIKRTHVPDPVAGLLTVRESRTASTPEKTGLSTKDTLVHWHLLSCQPGSSRDDDVKLQVLTLETPRATRGDISEARKIWDTIRTPNLRPGKRNNHSQTTKTTRHPYRQTKSALNIVNKASKLKLII